jgi:hypothetical protein
MKVTDNRVRKRAEFYLSKEESLSFISAERKKKKKEKSSHINGSHLRKAEP